MKTRSTPITVKQHLTNVDSFTIYSELVGTGDPLVLIHGLGGSTRWWARNIEALSQHFQVHIVDLLGFGRSRCEQPFVLCEAAAHLVKWMRQLGIERANIVGHSMGGFIAAELAADFPEQVDRLVLVDAAVPVDKAEKLDLIDTLRSLPYLPFNFLDVLIPDLQRAGFKTVAAAARALLSTDISAKLAHIKAPTLVVWGERDPMVPLKVGEKLARSLPCRELAVIKGAGHNPMWDKPQAFNRVITEFLTSASPVRNAQPAQRPSGPQSLTLGMKTA